MSAADISLQLWIAALIAAVCLFLWSRKRVASMFIAALCWAAYAVYELLISNGIGCDAQCNLRVDLLLIFPVLMLVSLIAVIRYFKRS